MADDLPRWQPAPDAVCAPCHARPPGAGGILCPDCRAAIEAQNAATGDPTEASQ
jgi:hypothetical protein